MSLNAGIIAASTLLQALDDANIQWREKDALSIDPARCGILIGTAMGGMQTFATACEDLHFKVGTGCIFEFTVLYFLPHLIQHNGILRALNRVPVYPETRCTEADV